MKLTILRSGRVPAREQIYNQIKEQITSGDLPPDFCLPSIRRVSLETGVSVITVKNAYEQLEQSGFVEARAGSGFYVLPQSEGKMDELRAEALACFVAAAEKCARTGVTKQALAEKIEEIEG